jgi:hypothetical protein
MREVASLFVPDNMIVVIAKIALLKFRISRFCSYFFGLNYLTLYTREGVSQERPRLAYIATIPPEGHRQNHSYGYST